MHARRRWTVPFALALAVSATAASAPSALAQRGDVDVRTGSRAAVPAATRDARTALELRLGGEGAVKADPVTGGVRLIGRTDALLTGRSPADPADVALGYVRAHQDVFGVGAGDLASLKLLARTVSPGGITQLRWAQTVNGVPAYDSGLSANVTRDGRLINIGGAPVSDLSVPSTDPPLGPSAAHAAAQRDVGVAPDGAAADIGPGTQRPTTFGDGDRARLTIVADPGGDRLAWRLTVAGKPPYLYDVLVDAASGAVIARHSLTDFASSANVFEYHPGAAAGGATHVVDLASYLPANPTNLNGLFAHAYPDANNDDLPDAEQAESTLGSHNFLFSLANVPPAGGEFCPTAFTAVCTWDGGDPTTAATNKSFVTTQAFYFVSNFHDWLAAAPIGFDSGHFNFESADGDAVLVETEDGSGTNNANMSTPADGSSPRMQMYLFGAGSGFPAVDGALDASVVYHEYTHGLSNRLVGGDGLADGLYANQSGAMGEGWSDWYAMDYLVQHGFVTDTAADGQVVVGEYVTDDVNRGIRENALDCPVGSASVTHCPGTPSAGSGGFTYADLGKVVTAGGNPFFEVHADGEIWGETLWDLRTALGGAKARQLITDGMRLSPKQPSFLDMRDAILQADVADFGGADRTALWSLFAARGMGYGATTTSGNATHAVASFVVPPFMSADPPVLDDAAPLGDGDGSLEPGESTLLRVPLRNPAETDLTNVHATLTANTAATVVDQPGANYGTVTAGAQGNAGQPFRLTVSKDFPCGSWLSLTMSVTSDQGAMQFPVTVPVSSGRATYVATDLGTGLAIPDNQLGTGAVSTITIPSSGRVDKLRVSLGIDHTRVYDLHAWLRSPSGTLVDLMESVGLGYTGDSGRDLISSSPLIFDDDAVQPVEQPTPLTLNPLTGAYRPNEPLSKVAGQDRAGTWTLRVTDGLNGQTGKLRSWSLQTGEPGCAPPVTSTDDASAITTAGATLNGHLDPTGATTSAAFEYGTTTGYGTRTATTDFATGTGNQAFATNLTDLAPGTTYHFRTVALRGGSVVATGVDRAFSTAPTQAPTPTPTPTPTPLSPGARNLPKSVRVSRSGRYVLAFTGGPAAAKGTLTLILGKKTKVGSARFTVPASGKVRVALKLSKRLQKTLRHKHRLRVKLTIRLNGKTFKGTVTLRR